MRISKVVAGVLAVFALSSCIPVPMPFPFIHNGSGGSEPDTPPTHEQSERR